MMPLYMLYSVMSTTYSYIKMQLRVCYNDYVDSEKQSSKSGFSEISEVSHRTEALRILAKIIAKVHIEHSLRHKTKSGETPEKEQ